jgi:hypothetical protein
MINNLGRTFDVYPSSVDSLTRRSVLRIIIFNLSSVCLLIPLPPPLSVYLCQFGRILLKAMKKCRKFPLYQNCLSKEHIIEQMFPPLFSTDSARISEAEVTENNK